MTWTFKLARRMASQYRRFSALVLVGGVAALTACGGSVAGPSDEETTPPPSNAVAGWLTVDLTTPHNDDGAVQFYVTGPTSIDSLRAVGLQGYAAADGVGAQLIATGQLHTGTVGRFFVKDIARASDYHVAIVAAAARTTYALQDLQGYSATVHH